MSSDRCTTCGKLKESIEVYLGVEHLFTRKIQRCECRELTIRENLTSLDEAIKVVRTKLTELNQRKRTVDKVNGQREASCKK